MALVLSAYDVVVRVDALPEGVSAFARTVPNATFCTDGLIARASFMAAGDRDHFVSRLVGIQSDAIARVDRRLQTVDAAWLERGRHSGVEAVWLRGAPRDPLVVPLNWTPGELIFGTWDEMKEHLEFIGVEGNVEVYLDKRTGKKLYTGRSRPVLSPEQQASVARLRGESAEILKPLFPKIFGKQALGFFEKRRLKTAVTILERLLEIATDDGAAHWTLGMIHRSGGEHGRALEHFRRAYEASPGHRDVGREYAGQCFILGAAADGVRLSRELHRNFPEDVGLHSNLALALLIGGDLDEALATAQAAHEREPGDPVTRNLLDYIGKVKRGLIPRPTRLPGT